MNWRCTLSFNNVAGQMLLLTVLLLTAPIQPGLLKHNVYRSLSLICFLGVMASHYLLRATPCCCLAGMWLARHCSASGVC